MPTEPTTLAQWIAVDAIDESPFNPRRAFDPEKLKVLVESVRTHGVKQPILVRPLPLRADRYELVFGARRLRASKDAGLEKIPATVEDLREDEVLELQVIENRDREDVHLLDEAQHYRLLHEQHGRSVDELVARFGVSRGTVYARLKLASIDSKAAERFRQAETPASIILEVARIQNPADQRNVAKEVTDDQHGEPMSVREAREYIRDHFHLRLRSAGFPLEDADLVPAAGPCTTCPKRSGNQAELFADVSGKGSADVCTDRICFEAKREAWRARQLAQARDAGLEVLEGKQAEKLFRGPYFGEKRHHLQHGAPFVDLADVCEADPKHRTYQRLLPKAKRPPTLAAVDSDGRVHELIRSSDVAKALKATGHDFGRSISSRVHDARDTGEAERRRKDRAQTFLRRRVIFAIGDAAAKSPSDETELYRLLAETLIGEVWTDYAKDSAERRGVARRDVRDGLRRWAAKASAAALRSLVIELVVANRSRWDTRFSKIAKRAGALFGLEVGKVQRAARADLQRLAKSKAPRKKKGAKPRAKKKPPARAPKKKPARKKKRGQRSAKR